jgi:heat shock protein HtpX
VPPGPDGGLLYNRIESNRRKTVVVVTLFGAATLLFVGYLAMWFTALVVSLTTGGSSPAGHEVLTAKMLSAALAVISALPLLSYLGYSLSPQLLLRMVRARRIGPNQEPELRRIVENLSIGAGLPAPQIYVIESSAPNAFATGLDPGHASVIVTRGLLRLLERGELEGVIAHEFSHIGNGDTRLNMMTAALAMTLRLPVTALHWLWNAIKKKLNGSPEEFRTTLGLAVYGVALVPILLTFAIFLPAAFWSQLDFLGPVMLLLPVYVFILAPILAPRVSSAVSREREYLADADAVLLTRNPEALARALAKIAAANRPAYANPAVAHLYIADPSGASQGRSRTHPPVQERIARLAEIGRIPLTVIDSAAAAVARTIPEPAAFEAFGDYSSNANVVRLSEPARLFQSPSAAAPELASLPESTLLITFAQEGEFIQAVTADRVFGYLHESTRSSPVDMDPADVQAHLPPPPTGEAAGDRLSDSQAVVLIVLFALAFFVVMLWVLLDFVPR